MNRTTLAAGALLALLALAPLGGRAATILDSWSTIAAPTPPPVGPVKLDPSTTAFLAGDWDKQTCGGPRCNAALPTAVKLLQAARAAKATVIYSYVANATAADVMPGLAPLGTEPSVQAGPDKFIGTDLQAILTKAGIKTIVVTGMTAQGVVLYTASHAALLGYDIVIPIDAVPAELPYAQQFVIWNLANAPRISARVKLTTSDQLSY